MKVAIVSNTSFNIFNFRLGLIKHLQKSGIEVVYVAPYDEYVNEISQQTNAKFFELKKLSRKGYNPVSEILLCKELYEIFKKEKIDVSISYTIKPNIYCALAAKLCGIKSILNITGLGAVFLNNHIGNYVAKWLLWFSNRIATQVVFQNNTDKVLFEKNGYVNSSKSVLINGSGINIDKYQSSRRIQAARPMVFLFIGRLLYDKGVREYVGAAKRLHQLYPEIKFQMLGALDTGNPSAVSQTELNNWLLENPQLSFLGHQKQIIPWMDQCHVVVLPSYREGIPRVLLESMAMRKPFVTVNSPGCEDVTIDGKNGLLAKVGDVESLFKQMQTIYLMSAEQREEMGEFGRIHVHEKYDEKIIVDVYLKLLLSLS